MSDEQSDITPEPIGKIIEHDEGLGTTTPEMVEERARELALMDGRSEPNDADREQARKELLGPADDGTPPEAVDKKIDQLVEWDVAPEESGERAKRVLPEDEANIAETLVEEGLEEADHDRRLSAVENNPPADEET